MSDEKKPIFLDRETYRKRRMVDAARILPLFGLVLLAIPMLWSAENGTGTTTTQVIKYVFGVWVVLVILGAALSSHLRTTDSEAKDDFGTMKDE